MRRLRDALVDEALLDPAPAREDLQTDSITLLPRADEAILQFGRFSLLLRQRQLVADGVPVKLGTRGFDLLQALVEADGSLVTKDELFSRVWPGIFVTEENLKTQISVLRKALGKDRNFILTEVGRGYRFIGEILRIVRSSSCHHATRWHLGSAQKPACPRKSSRRSAARPRLYAARHELLARIRAFDQIFRAAA